jgi:hypothetical protein
MPEDNKNTDQMGDDFLDDAMRDIDSSNTPVRAPEVNRIQPEKPKGFKAKLKDLFVNPKKRKVIIASTFAAVILLAIVPNSRYLFLNTVGVRSSASVKVLDESTNQPLRNVNVLLAGAEAKTDENGVARVQQIKLGKSQLVIEKRAFAKTEKNVTVGWGSNPLGEFKIKPVGVQYQFKTVDFLTGKPIEKVEAVSGEYSAFSNAEGLAVITIEDPGEGDVDITLKAAGYRDEPVTQATESKDAQEVKMVPARKHVFVSKRSGKYDVYQIDADGKNEKLILSGTGNEREDITLVSHPDKNFAVLVSSRGSQRNDDGFLLSSLTLIDMEEEEVLTEELDLSERIQIVGWAGDNLSYIKIADGASADTPDRHRLITYNLATGDKKQLAASNYFNDVVLVGNTIYHAASAAYQKGKVGLVKVNIDGSSQSTVFDQEVWNIFRVSFDKLMFSVQDDWYEYNLNEARVLAAAGPPATQITRVYIDGPEAKRSLWIDQRDGKGALIVYDKDKAEDKTIKTQSGLTYPVRWLNTNTAIYRINTEQETADYVVNLGAGEAKKITDVTNTGGIDRWYYY